jgi:hypothetical protein
MNKAALIVFADTETHADLARVVNAMMTAKELAEAGDDVELIFDGAATQWPGILVNHDHKSHRLFEQVHDVISGACAFCSRAFAAEEKVRRAEVPFLNDYKDHPSIRRLVHERFEVLTFYTGDQTGSNTDAPAHFWALRNSRRRPAGRPTRSARSRRHTGLSPRRIRTYRLMTEWPLPR